MFFFNSGYQTTEGNILQICNYVLNQFLIKHNKSQLDYLIERHIESNSLLAVKDVLYEYGVESAAIRKGNYSYSDFETPFISSIQQEDWPYANFTIITNVNDGQITYLDPIKNKIIITFLEEFERIDKGVVLLIDGSAKMDESNYTNNKNKKRREYFVKNIPIYLILATLLITATYLFLAESFTWVSLGFLFNSFIGLSIAIVLLWHEVDAHNPFIKEVCGANRKKINCGAVLSSSNSTFLGISWSIWGFAFMATLFLTQIIYAGEISHLFITSYLSIVVAPYIIFSIYYQWRVIKQWCPLCLTTQIVLAINFVIGILFIANYSYVKLINYYDLVSFVFLGTLFLVSSYLAIPILKKANDSKGYEKKWKKLRYNPEIFQALLNKSKTVTMSAENLGVLVGNPNANNEIIKVCHPYCGPCSKAHPELENIIKKNPDVRIRIIFRPFGETDHQAIAPITHLLAVQQRLGTQILHNALNDWYLSSKKDYEFFAKKYPMNGELKEQEDKILRMRDWCDQMKVRATPTIFINGKELPDSYLIEELKNFF